MPETRYLLPCNTENWIKGTHKTLLMSCLELNCQSMNVTLLKWLLIYIKICIVMQQLFRLIQSDLMAFGFSWIAFALMIFTYGLYIHKAMFYFGKSSISYWLWYRLIQTVGMLLILLFTIVGYGCRGHLIGSLVSIVLFLLSLYLLNYHGNDSA